MRKIIVVALLLAGGCVMPTAPREPKCIVSSARMYSYKPDLTYMCQCDPGATIPDVCGGGIAP